MSPVPKFTAFIQASGVGGLAQTLRAARIASDTLVIHDPAVQRLCLRYGAREKIYVPGVTPGAYATDAFHDWILLLQPGEELSDDAVNALKDWRHIRDDPSPGYLVRCRDDHRLQLRLVNRALVSWLGEFPPIPTNAGVFPGLIARAESLRAA
jgi:hypothetical protein